MIRSLNMRLMILVFFAFAAGAQNLPPGEGREIVHQKCGGCHAMKVVTSKRASKDKWSTLVDQMVTRGADIEDEDIETVVDYLAKNFGSNAPSAHAKNSPTPTGTVNVNSASSAELAAALHLSVKESASIVSYREQNGNFRQWRDLTKVPGIEIKKIEINKNRLVF